MPRSHLYHPRALLGREQVDLLNAASCFEFLGRHGAQVAAPGELGERLLELSSMEHF